MKPNYVPNKYELTTDLLLNPNKEVSPEGIKWLADQGIVTIEGVQKAYPIGRYGTAISCYPDLPKCVQVVIRRVNLLMWGRTRTGERREEARKTYTPRTRWRYEHLSDFIGSTHGITAKAVKWFVDRGLTTSTQVESSYPKEPGARTDLLYSKLPKDVLRLVMAVYKIKYQRRWYKSNRAVPVDSFENSVDEEIVFEPISKPTNGKGHPIEFETPEPKLDTESREMSISEAARLYPHLKIKVYLNVKAAVVI